MVSVQRAGGPSASSRAGLVASARAIPTLLPDRPKLVRVVACTVGKAHKLEHFQGAGAAVLLRPAGNLQGELDVTEHGAGVHQVELLEDHTDVGACFAQFESRLPEISKPPTVRVPLVVVSGR